MQCKVPLWARIGKTFSPPLDLGENQAIGLWVHGDGRGELLNIQVKSPEHVSGGVGDHYVVVDFTGWKYFELIETEGERVDEYAWPYSKNVYHIYRQNVDFGKVGHLNLWLNNVPPNGKVTCCLSPVKALKLVKTKTRNPSITVGGETLVFPVEIDTGAYLEFNSMNDCKLYGPDGELLQEVKPKGVVPNLGKGENAVRFLCASGANENPRVRLALSMDGEAL